jgi:hypothetical protein
MPARLSHVRAERKRNNDPNEAPKMAARGETLLRAAYIGLEPDCKFLP